MKNGNRRSATHSTWSECWWAPRHWATYPTCKSLPLLDLVETKVPDPIWLIERREKMIVALQCGQEEVLHGDNIAAGHDGEFERVGYWFLDVQHLEVPLRRLQYRLLPRPLRLGCVLIDFIAFVCSVWILGAPNRLGQFCFRNQAEPNRFDSRLLVKY